MPDPYIREVGSVQDTDGMTLAVGVDYDAVTIGQPPWHVWRLTRTQAEGFARARMALLLAMAQRVVDGEFDASKEESDAWAASPEGQETFRQLADDVVFGGMVRDMKERGGG